MARPSVAVVGLIAFAFLGGCRSDENSPTQGAVPPKPDLSMTSKLPPEIRSRMQGQTGAKNSFTEQMAKAARARKGAANGNP
jgi:hypothetical protein